MSDFKILNINIDTRVELMMQKYVAHKWENDTMRFVACLHAYTKRLCKKKNCGPRSDCVQTRSFVQRRTAYKEDTITKKIPLQRRYYYIEDTITKKIILQRR